MKTLIGGCCLLFLFFHTSFSFASSIEVQEVSLTYDEVDAVGTAVFVLEKILDTSQFSRDQMVAVMRDFGVKRGLESDPRFVSLLAGIDYKNQGVVIDLSGNGTYVEYMGGVVIKGTLEKIMVPEGLSCGAISFPGNGDCRYKEVLHLVDVDLVSLVEVYAEKLPFWYNDSNYGIGCTSESGIQRNLRWKRGGRSSLLEFITREEAIDDFEVIPDVRSQFLGQILPLAEQNYGSHGTSNYHCQSKFNRINMMQ